MSSRSFDTIVVTLGFEPSPIVRAVASLKIREGGNVIVFAPSYKDERAERAYLEFKKICGMIYEKFRLNIEKIEVNLSPFNEAVRTIRRVFSELAGKDVAICITGSMRALCLAVMVAYLLVKWTKIPQFEVQLEGRIESVQIPPLCKTVGINIGEEKLAILRIVASKERVTIAQLVALTEKDRSTIYRHLRWLIQKGFIRRENREVRITDLGSLVT